MKKKQLIIIGIIVVIIIIIVGVFLINIKGNKKVSRDDLINQNLDFIASLSKKYSRVGNLDVTANYRGAHGENNPHDFEYEFEVEGGKLFIGNEKGFSYLSDFNYLDIINLIADIKNKLKVTKIDTNIYSMDTEMISDILYKRIDSITLETKSKENIMHIKYDDKDETITFNEDFTSAKGTFFDKEIKYNKTSQGISLQYGFDFKMNVFTGEDKVEYSIVNGPYVYKILLYEDKITASVSGEAAIYKGLDMTFNFVDGLRVDHDKIIDSKNICITRYFNALGKVGSEY